MKERREEDNKDSKELKKIQMNPFIFAVLKEEAQALITGKARKYDIEMGDFNELKEILYITTDLTGYTEKQLKQKTKGRIGLSTTRQAFMIAAYEAVANKSTVGRFINRDHSSVVYTCDTVRGRIGMKGYELLTTIYTDIKQLYNDRNQK